MMVIDAWFGGKKWITITIPGMKFLYFEVIPQGVTWLFTDPFNAPAAS